MAEDFDTLKSMMWEQFRDACTAAKSNGNGSETRAQNRVAVGTIGAALIQLEKEQREAASAEPAFKMPGK